MVDWVGRRREGGGEGRGGEGSIPGGRYRTGRSTAPAIISLALSPSPSPSPSPSHSSARRERRAPHCDTATLQHCEGPAQRVQQQQQQQQPQPQGQTRPEASERAKTSGVGDDTTAESHSGALDLEPAGP
jgi:hypothetical protein